MNIIITEYQLKKIIIEQKPLAIDYTLNPFKKKLSTTQDFFKQGNNINSDEISAEQLAKYLKELNIVHPDIALAQAMLESGQKLKSDLVTSNKNLFGMKQPAQRKTTSIGKKNGHASYKNFYESAKDYKLWQQERKMDTLPKEQYLQKLNKIYCISGTCGTNDYASRVKQLLGVASKILNSVR